MLRLIVPIFEEKLLWILCQCFIVVSFSNLSGRNRRNPKLYVRARYSPLSLQVVLFSVPGNFLPCLHSCIYCEYSCWSLRVCSADLCGLSWWSSITLRLQTLVTYFPSLSSSLLKSDSRLDSVGLPLSLCYRMKAFSRNYRNLSLLFSVLRDYCPPLSLCLSLRVPFKPLQDRVSQPLCHYAPNPACMFQRRKREKRLQA